MICYLRLLVLVGMIGNCAELDTHRRYVGISVKNPTGSAAISADGLAAAYDFETYTSDGMLRDFGPFGNHGKVKQKKETGGRFGKARVFSDVGDLVDLPEQSSFNLDGPLTVATWIQITTLNLHQHIFACDDKFVLWVTPTNQYRFADTLGDAFTTEEGVVQTESWHSVVAVLYGTRGDSLTKDNIKIFVDGTQMEGSFGPVWAPTVLHPTDACHIGFESHQGQSRHQELQFEGVVDELLVFSRALTDDEIQTHAERQQ